MELLERDSLQEQANKGWGGSEPALDLSGAIDILPQLKSGVPPPSDAMTDVRRPRMPLQELHSPALFMSASCNVFPR